MTKEDISETALLYLSYLYSRGFDHVRADPEKNVQDLTPRQIRNHCVWMCERIEQTVRTDPDTARQWLGFVQGCLFCLGDYTIDDLRKHGGVKSIP